LESAIALLQISSIYNEAANPKPKIALAVGFLVQVNQGLNIIKTNAVPQIFFKKK
jgi:hypothetical protein